MVVVVVVVVEEETAGEQNCGQHISQTKSKRFFGFVSLRFFGSSSRSIVYFEARSKKSFLGGVNRKWRKKK